MVSLLDEDLMRRSFGGMTPPPVPGGPATPGLMAGAPAPAAPSPFDDVEARRKAVADAITAKYKPAREEASDTSANLDLAAGLTDAFSSLNRGLTGFDGGQDFAKGMRARGRELIENVDKQMARDAETQKQAQAQIDADQQAVIRKQDYQKTTADMARAEEEQAAKRNLRDPNSRESKVRQAIMKRFGAKLGMSPEQINAISAADYDDAMKAATLAETVDARLAAAKLAKTDKSKPTDNQITAAGFARRLEQSEKAFDKLINRGFDRTKSTERFGDYAPGEAKGADRILMDQAERNFINAVLRRESGAAISPAEFKNAEAQYFPRPGDTPETVEQKRANRLQALEMLKIASGPAYEMVPLVEPRASSGRQTAAGNASTQVEKMDKASGKVAIWDTSTTPPTFVRWK